MKPKLKKAVFVIFSCEVPSPDPADWKIVPHNELPEWLLNPDVLGQLVNGNVAMDCAEGTNGSLYYRAEVGLGAQEKARLDRAMKHREHVEARRLLELPADRPVIEIETSHMQH